jgi:signal transduction histidine kinase
METIRQLQQRLLRSRWLPRAGIGATLLILAGLIASGTWQLRQKTRAQIVGRDADILHGVAQMVQVTQEGDRELGGELERLPDQFAVALQISELNQLNGVIATRLFDTNGQFAAALPASVTPDRLSSGDLQQLRALKPISHFHAEADLAGLFLPDTTAFSEANRISPLLEVVIPLHRQKDPALVGVIQFLIDGQGVAAQFAALDRNLLTQATTALVAGGGIILAVLGWAFRRLQRTNRLLVERTSRLLRANEDLALSAKTSAVGAITAHLVHGLSSPLSGLQEFVASRANEDGPEPEWRDVLINANQMQALIGEVVRVLGEEHGVDRYEISLRELVELLAPKVRTATAQKGVGFHTRLTAQGSLANREANLVMMILENLLRNAVQATPAGREVGLEVAPVAEGVEFRVTDGGAGVPAEVQAKLFKPCRSTKSNGHGIGLAISHQLAHHLGAKLELAGSTAKGSIFALRLPSARFCQNSLLDSGRVLG